MSENKLLPVSCNNTLTASPGEKSKIKMTKEDSALKGKNFASSLDPDEQFVLDIIRTTKKESIEEMIEMMRAQESKSVMLVRILERYQGALDYKGEKVEE